MDKAYSLINSQLCKLRSRGKIISNDNRANRIIELEHYYNFSILHALVQMSNISSVQKQGKFSAIYWISQDVNTMYSVYNIVAGNY